MLEVAGLLVAVGAVIATVGRIFGSQYIYEKGMGVAGLGLIIGFIAMALK